MWSYWNCSYWLCCCRYNWWWDELRAFCDSWLCYRRGKFNGRHWNSFWSSIGYLIVNRYLKLSNSNKELTKKEIYQLGKNGDKKVIEIFNETGRNIGVGLVNIINGLSPELLVIGGGIVEIKDYIYEEIIKKLEESALSVSYKKAEIKFSKLGSLAAVYGMADSDAWDTFSKLVPDDFINEACARIIIRMDKYEPVKYAARVRCPVLFQVCDNDFHFQCA